MDQTERGRYIRKLEDRVLEGVMPAVHRAVTRDSDPALDPVSDAKLRTRAIETIGSDAFLFMVCKLYADRIMDDIRIGEDS